MTENTATGRLAISLGFIVLMALVATVHACNNITPVNMAEHGQCWNSVRTQYQPCEVAK